MDIITILFLLHIRDCIFKKRQLLSQSWPHSARPSIPQSSDLLSRPHTRASHPVVRRWACSAPRRHDCRLPSGVLRSASRGSSPSLKPAPIDACRPEFLRSVSRVSQSGLSGIAVHYPASRGLPPLPGDRTLRIGGEEGLLVSIRREVSSVILSCGLGVSCARPPGNRRLLSCDVWRRRDRCLPPANPATVLDCRTLPTRI